MKSTDCVVELNRNSNTDYTIAVKNDVDKNLSEKSNTAAIGLTGAAAAAAATSVNLFVDNSKNKRDKSPTMKCQSNGNTNDIILDNNTSRINMENIAANKKIENQHNGGSAAQSDANNTTSAKQRQQNKTICYDFKKGMCRRRFCRYPHVMNTDQVVFCHDFQNTGCFRANCRFIHRSIEDEEYYRAYGVFPVPTERPQLPPPPSLPPQPINHNQSEHHVPQQATLPMPAPSIHPPPPSHLNYYSNHDNNMMVNQQQTQPQPQPQQQQQQHHQQQQSPPIFSQNSAMPLTLGARRRHSFGMNDGNMDMPTKRSHIDEIRSPTVSTANYNSGAAPQNGDNSQHGCRFIDQSSVNGAQQQPPPQQSQASATPNSVAAQVQSQPVRSVVISEDVINIYRLYEEHNLLRRRVEINEERLQELRATNSYLLQQNEQLRRQTQCSCANTIVNPVTLTTASQQSAAPVINAVSIAPVQVQATPIVSIASIGQPQTQIIASSTPLAIAANTTQGQQLALASTQQAGQILGTPQITLAAPSMGITMNTSQPLAMSANATQPIISYPVMTHSILPH